MYLSCLAIFALIFAILQVAAFPADWDEISNTHVWTPESSDNSPNLSQYDDAVPWCHQHRHQDAFSQMASEPLETFIDPLLAIQHSHVHGVLPGLEEEEYVTDYDRDPLILSEFNPYYLHPVASEEDLLSNLAEDLSIVEDARDPHRGRTPAEEARHRARQAMRRSRRRREYVQARMNRDHFEQIYEFARVREGTNMCKAHWLNRLRRRDRSALALQQEYWSLFN